MCEKSVISRILDIEQFSYLEKRFILDIQTSYLLEVDNIFYDWISVLRSNKSIQCAKQEFSTIVSVTPTGDMYPCQMLIGHKEFLLGNVHKNTYRNISIQSSIKTDCCDCWLRYICSGGCYALAFLINGDVNKRKINDICKKIQEMYKCGAYIYSCLSENEFKKIIDIWCRTSGF